MLALQTILHPTDFSDRSDVAFRLACSMASKFHAKLVLMHVVEPPLVVAGEGAVILPIDVDLETPRRMLEQFHQRDLSIPMEDRVVEGYPAPEILFAADETKCDMIVLGSHGRTGLNRLLMGSVAEQVQRKAACPVVMVKTQLHEIDEPKTAVEPELVQAS